MSISLGPRRLITLGALSHSEPTMSERPACAGMAYSTQESGLQGGVLSHRTTTDPHH
jgi:hypothetical protein